jgi:acyl-CoA thioester hydrolase
MNMSHQELFRYTYHIDIRYADLDVLGHVNNAKYFTYMETARVRYFADVVGWDGQWHTLSIILARTSCDFKLPLGYGDGVKVCVRTSRLGKKSFDMAYALIREQDEALAAIGISTQVAYDYETRQSIPIPDSWRAKMVGYEPGLT